MLDSTTIEQVRDIVRINLRSWRAISPKHGPCWAISRALANAGWGRVEFCRTKRVSTKRWYGHYILRDAENEILDFSGEYLDNATNPKNVQYRGFEPAEYLKHDFYSAECVEFWEWQFASLTGKAAKWREERTYAEDQIRKP